MLSKAVLAVCVSSVAAYVDRGILKLDNTCASPSPLPLHRSRRKPFLQAKPLSLCHSLGGRTFDRLIDGSRNVIVRFDKEYSYGDEHDAWKDFAKTVGESSADMLVGDVGVSGAPPRMLPPPLPLPPPPQPVPCRAPSLRR